MVALLSMLGKAEMTVRRGPKWFSIPQGEEQQVIMEPRQFCLWIIKRIRFACTYINRKTAPKNQTPQKGWHGMRGDVVRGDTSLFARQEYWSRQPIPSPRDLPNPGIKPGSPALQVDSLPTELGFQYSSANTPQPVLAADESRENSRFFGRLHTGRRKETRSWSRGVAKARLPWKCSKCH